MKILVFDDTEKHRKAAAVQLKDHDVVIVETYDEAQAALLPHKDELKAIQIFEDKYGDTDPYKSDERVAYFQKAREITTTYPDFDVVLTDLLVPASKQEQGRESELAGQEMPLGSIIALLAIVAGIKKVAVVTDANHHNHPASAALDCFGEYREKKEVSVFCTNGKTMCVDEKTLEPLSYKFLDTPKGRAKYPQRSSYSRDREGITFVKNWAGVLEILMEE